MSRYLTDRRFWLVPLMIWTMLVSGSLAWNIVELKRATRQLLINEGRFVFSMIQATRQWNAQHGGVYGLRDANTPSNPYLEAAEKDLITPSGRALTLLNPAYMTRQLGEVIHEQTGIRIHITSLNPINPGNAAKDWEIDALKSFDSGELEHFELTETTSTVLARYMAPLITKQACLKCHQKQGYKVGDVRGGLGVVYTAKPFMDLHNGRLWQIGVIHAISWLSLSFLTLLALHSIRKQILSLNSAKDERDRLIEERTTQLKEENRERKQAESRLRMLINFSGEGVLGMDKMRHCTFCNPVALRLLGYFDNDELLGKDLGPTLRPPAITEEDCRACNVLRHGTAIHEEDGFFVRGDGGLLPVEYRAHPIFSDGEIIGAVVTFSDITERKQTQARIWRQANYDTLTGLPNRELLKDRLDSAIFQARRRGGTVAVLFVDLDRFKEVNDRLGHDGGDEILREAGRRMSGCLRDTDTLARLGGDEFLIVLPLLEELEDAEVVASKIIEQLTQPFRVGTQSAQLSASIGIAYYPDDADNDEALLHNADLAMYRAKNVGRATYRLYSAPFRAADVG